MRILTAQVWACPRMTPKSASSSGGSGLHLTHGESTPQMATQSDTDPNGLKDLCTHIGIINVKNGSPYSITERWVPELIPVLGSQPAGDVSHNPAVGCHYFPTGLQLPLQPFRGLLQILLLGEQRHDGCEQFA